MQFRTKFAAALAVTMLVAGATACVNPQEVSDVKTKVGEMAAKVDGVEQQQKAVIAKLDALAKGQKDILAKAGTGAKAAPSRPAEDPNKVYDIEVGDSYFKGPKDAKVTVVEWSDFQCPFCARSTGLIDQLIEAYPNDLKFVYKNYPLPFHKEAMPAAKAAIAAGKQGKFFEMHDKLFENYRTLSTENYAKWAGELGLDVEKFKTDMAAPETQALVTEEMKQAQKAGVRGTPTFFINGKKPAGRSFELYKGMIDEALKAKS